MMTTQQPQLAAPQKRPRLSLKINTDGAPSPVAANKPRGFHVDPTDPTSFNTLSNAYVTAIERSTPIQAEPLTAINTLQALSLKTPVEPREPVSRMAAMTTKLKVRTPYVAAFPETPTTEYSASPPQQMEMTFPSTMTPTPPLSAGVISPVVGKVFSFSAMDTTLARSRLNSSCKSPISASSPLLSPRLSRRHAAVAVHPYAPAPYTHPRSLHSILRNSPLPPRTAVPPSPRRQSLRLLERAAKKVGYNNPLTQTITTNKYIKSHIDLLTEEASPASPNASPADTDKSIDLVQVYAPHEVEDGGQTPGPFEDMRRKLASLASSTTSTAMHSPVSGGVRKRSTRKKREKKRQWVWTIGVADEEEENEESLGGAIAALRASASASAAAVPKPRYPDELSTPMTAILAPQMVPETPTTSIESGSVETAVPESNDVDMSDVSSVISEDIYHHNEAPASTAPQADADTDMVTPTATKALVVPAPSEDGSTAERHRDTPIPELAES